MVEKPSETTIRVWARLVKAQRFALAGVEQALKVAGLPPLAWYDVLLEVERVRPFGIRPFELQRTMLLAQYNLSRLVDRIEEAGYVERRGCGEDGRGQLVHITHAGRMIRRKMWTVYARAIEANVGQHLSVKQAEQLADLLGNLIEGLEGPR